MAARSVSRRQDDLRRNRDRPAHSRITFAAVIVQKAKKYGFEWRSWPLAWPALEQSAAWVDIARRFRAFDADDGEVLWEAVLGGTIQTSTITYAVDGRQYVAVLTGNGTSGTGTPASISGIEIVQEHNAIYSFALPRR